MTSQQAECGPKESSEWAFSHCQAFLLPPVIAMDKMLLGFLFCYSDLFQLAPKDESQTAGVSAIKAESAFFKISP